MTKTINREHPEYAARKAMWRRYRDLYAGGEQLREHASDYLARRHKEPNEIYAERLSRVFYENYIGSIVDWYAATLMRREPVMTFDGNGRLRRNAFYAGAFERLRPQGDDPDASSSGRDRGDAGLRKQLYRGRFSAEQRTGGDARGGGCLGTLAGVSGGLRTRMKSSTGVTTSGQMEWVVIRTSCLQQSKVTDATWERETRWIYYDRENFQIYCSAANRKPIELIDEGRHGFAGAQPRAGVSNEGDATGCG